MAEEPQVIMLNGGRDVSVALVSGADAFLMQLLGGTPSKTGGATLKVVKNAAGVPFVAVIIANKHVGFLSHADAEGLLSVLADCEQKGAVATAKAVLAVTTDGTATPALKLNLASPDRLLTAPTPVATPPIVAPPETKPLPGHHCQGCGTLLPADARFCLACGTPVAGTPAPAQRGVAPASSVRSTQPVAAPASVPTAPTAAPAGQVPWQPQYAKAPVKGRGWWRRQSSRNKALLISGAVVVFLVVIAIGASAAGGSGTTTTTAGTVAANAAVTTGVASATTEAASPTSTVAPTTTQAATGPVALELVESGYSYYDKYVHYAVIIKNPNAGYGTTFPTLRYTMRDASGGVLGTGEQVCDKIMPGETIAWAGQADPNGVKPATVEFEILPPEYDWQAADEMEPIGYKPFVVTGLRAKKSSYSTTFTGEVVNDNGSKFDRVAITVVLRDKAGKIVGGDSGFAESVSANGNTPFQVETFGDIPPYAKAEAYGQIWM